jgi:hypothetical protein
VDDHTERAWWLFALPASTATVPANTEAMNGLDGWTCSIFRNTGPRLSSELVLEAERLLVREMGDCGPSGLLTYVWDRKVRSSNPGYCFKVAGWSSPPARIAKPRSADGRKTLLWKPYVLAGIAACGFSEAA